MEDPVSFKRLLLVASVILAAGTATAASAQDNATLKYAVMRNGDTIGSTTVRLVRDGAATLAEVATHVQVKVAYITVYRFDEHETERLGDDGRLLALKAVTDDNGTVHNVSATRDGNMLAVDADGKRSTIDPTLIPVSLWNAALLEKTKALNPQDGRITPVSVVDRGEDRLVLDGRPTPAHHYSIDTGIAQDVWYDRDHRLVKVELQAIDGSKILYRLG